MPWDATKFYNNNGDIIPQLQGLQEAQQLFRHFQVLLQPQERANRSRAWFALA
jgi:hypothetical protein